jgi:hypothetical protein
MLPGKETQTLTQQHPGHIHTSVREGARPIRWSQRALSVGLVAGAMLMGVHLGMDAPAESPVSPAAQLIGAPVAYPGHGCGHHPRGSGAP